MIGKNIPEDNLFGRNTSVKIFQENIFLDNNISYQKYLRAPPGKKICIIKYISYQKYLYILDSLK